MYVAILSSLATYVVYCYACQYLWDPDDYRKRVKDQKAAIALSVSNLVIVLAIAAGVLLGRRALCAPGRICDGVCGHLCPPTTGGTTHCTRSAVGGDVYHVLERHHGFAGFLSLGLLVSEGSDETVPVFTKVKAFKNALHNVSNGALSFLWGRGPFAGTLGSLEHVL